MARALRWVSRLGRRRFATGRGDVAGEVAVSETEFHAKAEVSLQRIFESLDAGCLDCVDDLGYEDGVLTVKLESGRTFAAWCERRQVAAGRTLRLR